MRKSFEFFKWFLKNFSPFIIIGLIIIIHLTCFHFFSGKEEVIHGLFRSFFQLTIGIVIIVTIIRNIEKNKNKDFLSLFTQLLKTCPLCKQKYVIKGEARAYLSGVTLDAFAYTEKTWETEEERFIELERRINVLRKTSYEEIRNLRKDISNVNTKLFKRISKSDENISEVRDDLSKLIIGDFQFQIFVLLLVIYAFVIDLILIY